MINRYHYLVASIALQRITSSCAWFCVPPSSIPCLRVYRLRSDLLPDLRNSASSPHLRGVHRCSRVALNMMAIALWVYPALHICSILYRSSRVGWLYFWFSLEESFLCSQAPNSPSHRSLAPQGWIHYSYKIREPLVSTSLKLPWPNKA